jgi:L-ascorbate metabolism protein UlaG (beta-lactamase superfamily)
MKVTKFVHSCLLVETPDRVALFDPGVMSTSSIDLDQISQLDDIFITHAHPDHFDVDFIKKLIDKFPTVRITTTSELTDILNKESIKASPTPPAGVEFFDSPHEQVEPLFPGPPQEIGIHYLDVLSDPGDSHSFTETKQILALPMQAPWGSNVNAMAVALKLKPRYVLPIHDWHWHDDARRAAYDRFEQVLGEQGIKFFKLETGQPVDIEV